MTSSFAVHSKYDDNNRLKRHSTSGERHVHHDGEQERSETKGKATAGRVQNSGLDYIRSAPEGKIVPDSFTAEVQNGTLGAHFHDVDQFQVVFGVPGSFFHKKPIPEVLIHYVDAFVTYGPLSAEDSTLHYFTLRSQASTGIWFMPKDRDGLKYRGRRHFEFTPDPYRKLGDREIETQVIIEDGVDGLKARLITAGPGALIVADPLRAVNGQYLVVLNGSLTYDDKVCEAESLGWQEQSDGPSELTAGPQGCRVLIARFPSPSTPISHRNAASLHA